MGCTVPKPNPVEHRATKKVYYFSGHAEEKYYITPVELPKASNNRIIGGAPTTIEQYPFVVQIYLQRTFRCGGSLLTNTHVMSAAHCFVYSSGFYINPAAFTINIGSTHIYSEGTTHLVSAIRVHENYVSPASDNDIAVLLLRTAVTLSSTVTTAHIPVQGASVPENATVIAVGWGTTNVNSKIPSGVLNEVAIIKINRRICRKNFLELQAVTGITRQITNNMICAGILEVGGKDACLGDSGGPLLYGGVVVGVTSWGTGCAEAYYPGVFTKVSSYTSWINDTINRYNGANSLISCRVILAIPFLCFILSQLTNFF
ncbi:trypsin, alkaline B-like [Spodoptera litura]|uniref:Trypsin, alkaline B-like n=1 Tax=Spodoptera litura TaxID=69820 RepID=A0A9J7EU99_SPOLT|nr:trypsin, alkaline B-like [Spodoptera litura]